MHTSNTTEETSAEQQSKSSNADHLKDKLNDPLQASASGSGPSQDAPPPSNSRGGPSPTPLGNPESPGDASPKVGQVQFFGGAGDLGNIAIASGGISGGAIAVQQTKVQQKKRVQHQKNASSTPEGTGGDMYAPPGAVPVTGAYDFYQGRHDDFHDRYMLAVNPLPPPTYYLDYGGKYNLRFNDELRPQLTSAGKAWLDETSLALQQGIENERAGNPPGFDYLEKDDPAFTAFAYGTHADAYLYAGLENLNPFDLAMIGTTPDVQDLLTQSGLSQAVETGLRLLPYWGENLGLLDNNTAYLIDQLVRAGRPDIEAVVGVVHSITDQQVVQPLVSYIDGHLGTGATEFIANEARKRLQDETKAARTWVEDGLQQLGIPIPW